MDNWADDADSIADNYIDIGQVLLRMEETRKLRMRQRAEKWREQVRDAVIYVLAEFVR